MGLVAGCLLSAAGYQLDDLCSEHFPLSPLRSKLRDVSFDIHEGRGAAILRGLCPEKYSLKEKIIIFAGLASHVADKRGSQSSENDMISGPSNLVHFQRLTVYQHICTRDTVRLYKIRDLAFLITL